jgi:hypothetical protein
MESAEDRGRILENLEVLRRLEFAITDQIAILHQLEIGRFAGVSGVWMNASSLFTGAGNFFRFPD